MKDGLKTIRFANYAPCNMQELTEGLEWGKTMYDGRYVSLKAWLDEKNAVLFHNISYQDYPFRFHGEVKINVSTHDWKYFSYYIEPTPSSIKDRLLYSSGYFTDIPAVVVKIEQCSKETK